MRTINTDSWLTRQVAQLPNIDEAELRSIRDRVDSAMRRAGLVHSGQPNSRALEPLLIEGDVYDRNLELTNVALRGYRIAVEALLDDAKLRRAIGIPTYMDEFFMIDSGHDAIPFLGRFDGFAGATGELAGFIEFNAAWSGGLHEYSVMNRLFAGDVAQEALAGIGRVREQIDPLDRLWQALQSDAESHGITGTLRIASPSLNNKPEPRPWLSDLENRGATVFFAPAEQFEFDGEQLTFSGEKIDYVVLEALDAILMNAKHIRPIRAAIEAGCVRTPQSISFSLVAGSKNTFEVLSNPEYRYLFDEETITVLDKLIPWTRVLKDRKTTYRGEPIDLLSFVRERREQLIIKPSDGYEGMGVVLGWKADDATWERAITSANRRAFVVQERIAPPPPQDFWMFSGEEIRVESLTFDFNVFVWNMSTPELIHVRGSAGDGLLNVAAGEGSNMPYLVVDPLQDA